MQFEIRYRESESARPINYTLWINVDKAGRPFVQHERLRQRRRGQKHGQPFPFLDLRQGEGFAWSGEATVEQAGTTKVHVKMTDRQVLGISTLGTLSDQPRVSAFRSFLGGWYLSYFVPQLARTQPMSGADPHLDRTGEKLAKYLQFIERERPKAFRAMLTRIAKTIPGLGKFVWSKPRIVVCCESSIRKATPSRSTNKTCRTERWSCSHTSC